MKGREESLNVCRNYNTLLHPGGRIVLELCWKLGLECSAQLCQGFLKARKCHAEPQLFGGEASL